MVTNYTYHTVHRHHACTIACTYSNAMVWKQKTPYCVKSSNNYESVKCPLGGQVNLATRGPKKGSQRCNKDPKSNKWGVIKDQRVLSFSIVREEFEPRLSGGVDLNCS